MNAVRFGSSLWRGCLVFAVVFFGVAGPTLAAPQVAGEMDTGANVIVIRAQDVNAGQVYVESVTAAQDGWLLIRKDNNGVPGDMIGWAPVHRGTTTSARVDVQLVDIYGDDNITPSLWATLVPDPNALTPFVAPDFVALHAPSVAAVAFSSSTAVPSPTINISVSSLPSGANAITTHAQDATRGYVVIDSLTAAQAGWILVRKDAGGWPGQVLGFAPVSQGATKNLTLAIRTSNAKGDDVVTSVLWATLVADPNAQNPFAAPDAGVQQQASLASVAFGTR